VDLVLKTWVYHTQRSATTMFAEWGIRVYLYEDLESAHPIGLLRDVYGFLGGVDHLFTFEHVFEAPLVSGAPRSRTCTRSFGSCIQSSPSSPLSGTCQLALLNLQNQLRQTSGFGRGTVGPDRGSRGRTAPGA